mmetsp:Transcript_60668/g.161211  ORF Transcript_60668/g.161211 Transcript_60668/m.161211 type:complete len:206 (-) Transcript_60668:623-1240(-)
MLVFTSEMIVGATKFPLGNPDMTGDRPSNTMVAPCLSADSINPSMRALAAGEITGPTSTAESFPGPTVNFLAFSAKSGIQDSASPTKTAVESAMQRCPAAPKAAPHRLFNTVSLSASGITTPWFLAPMFDCTRFPLAVPRAWMCLPAAFPPTNEIALISGASQMKFTASGPPWMTFTTPSGTPASLMSSTSFIVVRGTRSDGFIT